MPGVERRFCVWNAQRLFSGLGVRNLLSPGPGLYRLFLALVVLISHSCRVDLGAWAVYSFFILSGYWLCRMWCERYSLTRAPIQTFFVSRLVRLLPVFWLANILSAFTQRAADPAFGRLVSFPAAYSVWAAISNTFILGYADLPHALGALHAAWSLDVELQFYLVVPLLALATCRPGGHPLLGRVLWWVIVAGFVAFLRIGPTGHRNLGCYGLYFYIGWWCARNRVLPSRRLAVAGGCLALLCVVAALSVSALRPLVENGKHGESLGGPLARPLFQAVLALVSAPFTLASLGNPSGRFDRTLGDFTYVLYLMQWPVMALHGILYSELSPLRRIPSLVVAWLAVAALSALIYTAIDRPIERARRRWVRLRLSIAPPERQRSFL